MSATNSPTWGDRFRHGALLGAVLWLVVVAGLMLLAVTSENVQLPWYVLAYLGLTLLASLASFVAYGLDKRAARKERPRISERTLHGLSLAGGWPGAVIASRVFHHKTVKLSFRMLNWSIVALHVTAVGYGLYRAWFG
jgi:uncharacterized membrane protein YsdA (DUF1294 family)